MIAPLLRSPFSAAAVRAVCRPADDRLRDGLASFLFFAGLLAATFLF